jgi:hypothetical protein
LEVRVVRNRLIRLSAVLVAVVPVVMFAWTIVGLCIPDLLGMHDGSG